MDYWARDNSGKILTFYMEPIEPVVHPMVTSTACLPQTKFTEIQPYNDASLSMWTKE